MTQVPDLYQVLMVDRAVDDEILEVVYRRLVGRYQPGTGGSAWAAGRLAAVERAYAILRDPDLRARYDARSAAREGAAVPAAAAASAPIGVVPVARMLPGSRALPGPPTPPATSVVRPATVRVVAERRPINPAVGVLDFGRYAGWSLRQLAAHDPDYLEWLVRSPSGRQFRAEITVLLGSR